jgi:ABC-2 type transport system permease protein
VTGAAVRETAPAEPTPAVRDVDVLGASLRALYIIWYRDVIRYWRDRGRVVASFAQPLLFLIVFGTGLSSSLRGAGGVFRPGVDYIAFMYPGILGMAVLFTAIFSAMSIVWDREFGFLKEILIAPIDRSAVAIGKTLGGATQAMIQALVLLALAPFAGVRLTLLSVVEILPLVAILAFTVSAIGVAIASRMRSMQNFGVVMNFLMMPLFFLSGALFPLTGLPGWMTVLTRLDPVAYGVDPLRRVVLSASGVPAPVLDRVALTLAGHTLAIPVEVAILLGAGVAMLAFAIYNFKRGE